MLPRLDAPAPHALERGRLLHQRQWADRLAEFRHDRLRDLNSLLGRPALVGTVFDETPLLLAEKLGADPNVLALFG